eukprot:12668759-Heterocapsa_arctica.AAC.1
MGFYQPRAGWIDSLNVSQQVQNAKQQPSPLLGWEGALGFPSVGGVLQMTQSFIASDPLPSPSGPDETSSA